MTDYELQKISLLTLAGFSQEVAEWVVTSKMVDKYKQAIREALQSHIILLTGERDKAKNFIMGKLAEAAITNKHTIFMIPAPFVVDYTDDFRLRTSEYVFITFVDTLSFEHLGLVQMFVAMESKKKHIILDLTADTPVHKKLKESFGASATELNVEEL